MKEEKEKNGKIGGWRCWEGGDYVGVRVEGACGICEVKEGKREG